MKIVTSLTALHPATLAHSSGKLSGRVYLLALALVNSWVMQGTAVFAWLQHTLTATSITKLLKHTADQALKQNLPSDDINTDFLWMLMTMYATALRSSLVQAGHIIALCSSYTKFSVQHIVFKAFSVLPKTKNSLECHLCKCM